MKAERWQQIERVWDEALGRPVCEREAYLALACAGDEELRRQVARLLAADEESEGFIEAPAIRHAAALLADASVHAMTGRALGRYEITSFLGAGGMGEVYLARDKRLNRPVALKILPAEFAGNESSLLRFEQEAQAVSALNHPNIITIYEVGEAEDLRFIATEYVEGVTLRRRASGASIGIDEAVEITIQIAAALSAAHGAGVVHSDIKPENVMVREDGIVKVLDFGIAKFTKTLPRGRKAGDENGAASSESEQGLVVGTLPYMSPEQAQGREVDARTDVWSLGVILYELVTGALPFRGSTTAERLSAILEQELPPLTSPAVPARLGLIIRHALQKNRDERYQSVKDLLGDLRELKEELHLRAAFGRASGQAFETNQGQGGSVITGAAPQRPESAAALNKYRWLGLTLVLLLAAASVALYLRGADGGNGRTDVRTDPLKTAFLTSYSGREEFPALSPDGNYVAFTWNGPGEDNYDIYIQGVAAGSPPTRLTTDPAADQYPAWSPDGKHLAFTRNSNIFIIEAREGSGGVERKVGEKSAGQISFYPDGKSLAITTSESGARVPPYAIYRLDIETGAKQRVTAPPADSDGDFNPVFSPDGRWLAFCRWLGDIVSDIYLLPADPRGGGEPRRLTADGRFVQGITWSEDGSAIIFSANRTNRHELWRVAVAGGAPPERIPTPSETSVWPSISRRGSRLAYEKRSSDMNIWRVQRPGAKDTTAAATGKLTGSSRAESSPQYSPDGKRIAFHSDRSGYEEIWLCDSDGSRPVQLTKIEGPLTRSPKWSPDGKWIAFDSRADDQPDIFVIGADGEGLRRLTDAKASDVVPSWSADGRFVYFGSNRGGDFQVWRVPAEGGEAQQVTEGGGFAPVASADGRYIYYAKGHDKPGVWRAPAEGGGEEVSVVGALRAGLWGYWAFTERGIYYVDLPDENAVRGATLDYYELSTGRTVRIAVLDKIPARGNSGLAVSADEQIFLYARPDGSEKDIILVENYR